MWGKTYQCSDQIQKFDAVFCNVDASQLTILHGLEFREHLNKRLVVVLLPRGYHEFSRLSVLVRAV